MYCCVRNNSIEMNLKNDLFYKCTFFKTFCETLETLLQQNKMKVFANQTILFHFLRIFISTFNYFSIY